MPNKSKTGCIEIALCVAHAGAQIPITGLPRPPNFFVNAMSKRIKRKKREKKHKPAGKKKDVVVPADGV